MTLSAWSWPVPLETYDRRPELDLHERAALADSVERMSRFQTPLVGNVQTCLQRLTTPLWAALAATGTSTETAQQTVNFLLHQMHQRKTSYWVWPALEWGEVADLSVSAHGTKTSLLCVAYLLGAMRQFYACGKVYHTVIAQRVFGEAVVASLIERIEQTLVGWGYCTEEQARIENAMTGLMLLNGNPAPESMSYDLLESFRTLCPWALKRYVTRISNVFAEWGILETGLPPLLNDPRPKTTTIAGIAPEWVALCQRWKQTSTMRPQVKQGYYYVLLQAGRWLREFYPHVTKPEQWTRDMAMAFVIHIRERKIGDYSTDNARLGTLVGKPLKLSTQHNAIGVMRAFFRDCDTWEWAKLSFDPLRYFKIPYREVYAKTPNPRIIADDLWAKLLWAGLNLQPEDLPVHHLGDGVSYGQPQYPFEMMRALAMVWLFSGLRSDEIRRLRVGCIRWDGTARDQQPEAMERICLLDVPVNKTSAAFTKPIAHLAGKAVEAWEAVRPVQPLQVDSKTHERVAFLFLFRGRRLGKDHLNRYLITLLCRKANIPQEDVRGRITSHRARSTIASQLANAREPMTLLELMQWLGHTSIHSTQHYVKITPGKLTQAYSEAGYFDRNLRTIRVLLDQDAIRSGATANGDAWKYYDLGHGYCSYDFFDQCPHRMACAKCAFYIPKESSAAQILEAKTNLQHMLQQIPLTDTEIAAVEDGLQALEHLQTRLLDVPTPSGKTPRDLTDGFVRLADIS
jgi:integrase